MLIGIAVVRSVMYSCMQEFQQALQDILTCQVEPNRSVLMSTSRCRATLDTPPSIMEMQPLSSADAETVLASLCPTLGDDCGVAKQLAEQCGNIPLALEVVANTIKQGGATAEVVLFVSATCCNMPCCNYCFLLQLYLICMLEDAC